jgi:hypothetical protein
MDALYIGISVGFLGFLLAFSWASYAHVRLTRIERATRDLDRSGCSKAKEKQSEMAEQRKRASKSFPEGAVRASDARARNATTAF